MNNFKETINQGKSKQKELQEHQYNYIRASRSTLIQIKSEGSRIYTESHEGWRNHFYMRYNNSVQITTLNKYTNSMFAIDNS